MRNNWMECDKSIAGLLGLMDDISMLRDVIRHIESKDKDIVEEGFMYAKRKRYGEFYGKKKA
tara:strand:- start:48 stop:233 length:186 start_codon:yes stop_codon:yes gene_type:complete